MPESNIQTKINISIFLVFLIFYLKKTTCHFSSIHYYGQYYDILFISITPNLLAKKETAIHKTVPPT